MSATISLLFGLLVAIVALATLATRLRLPYAILLVLGGLLLGFVPGLPSITLDPETHPGAFFAAADLLLGLADPLARIPREPAPDLAAVSRPGAGDHARHRRGGPRHRRLVLAGRLCPGSRGLAHRRRGGQRDRQAAGPAAPHRDRDRGREYGQ